MTVVDLGANIGYYSVITSKLVGTSGRVFAFEAHPLVFSYLQRNLERNGCKNVVAVEKAVSDSVASSPLILNGLEGGFLKGAADNQEHVVVQTTTLDAFFAACGWPRVDLIKIDIEGSEAAALEGMRQLSERNPELKVVMEVNSVAMRRSGVTAPALMVILRDLGFRRAYVIEQGMKEISFVDSRWSGQLLFNFLLVK
jgi:FkbM family methyltransferase